MSKKNKRCLESLPVDSVTVVRMHNGIVCIDIESDGRPITLKMGLATLVHGMALGQQLLMSGELSGFPRAAHL